MKRAIRINMFGYFDVDVKPAYGVEARGAETASGWLGPCDRNPSEGLGVSSLAFKWTPNSSEASESDTE